MVELTPGNSLALVRDQNQAAVLRLIAAQPRIARAEIARLLPLSPATVTAVTRRLIESGLVRVADRAPSRGGRPRLLLEIVGGAAHALGVKIAADHITAVRVDLDAEVLERHDFPFDAAAPDAVARLGDLLAPLVDDPGASLLGVGLGVPGVVGPEGHVDSPMLGWRDLPATELLQERLGVPVLADNDVNTLAVAERLYGRGREVDSFLTVTIGRGVGLGIVLAGNIYRGHSGGAGEFGHVTAVVEQGERCSCGKRGCLETVSSDPALVARARRTKLIGARQGIEVLRELAAGGNGEALALYAESGHALGRALADLVNVLDPALVLVSGEGIVAWPHLERAVEESFRAGLFPTVRGIQLEIDPWDDAKWARGAASLVLRPTFAPGVHDSRPHELVRARLAASARPQGAVA